MARVFEVTTRSEGGTVYGCVEGSTHVVVLWETEPAELISTQITASVKQLAGRFVAVETSISSQYGLQQSLDVFDLRSGASYNIASVHEEIGEPPPMAGTKSLEVQKFVLAADERTAALYATLELTTALGDGMNAPPCMHTKRFALVA